MKCELFLKKSFWAGFLLFLLLTLVAVWTLPILFWWKCLLVVLSLIFYTTQQLFQWPELTEGLNKKLIEKTLSGVEYFNKFNSGQRFRSNVFFCDHRQKKFYLKYGYNMDNYEDKNIHIPINMGCTGEAWRDRKQVWGDYGKIFSDGSYRIPQEELNKVPKDLQWICSTPILDDTGNVLAVLNFDGNKAVNSEQQQEIKNRGLAMAEELKLVLP